MTTIIIKSFNRPYYLDRCLKSIYDNIQGTFEIKVLDDGTPENYLTKIKKNYKEVVLFKSNQYNDKIKSIEDNLDFGKPIDGFMIPTDLWIAQVKKSSEYVLVIEDDVWVTNKFNIDDIVTEMHSKKIPLVKLGWLGNYTNDNFCKIDVISHNLKSVIPKKLFTSNKYVMDLFMYNKFKFFTILYKLKLVDNTTKSKYWEINSILMGLYQKDYWLAIWQDSKGKVDEKQQLRNAATWYHRNKKAIFARTHNEYLKTTFKSSATGSYHQYGIQFDVNRMNFILNEAWLNGKFDSMENYPKDFSDEYIKQFLESENHPDAQFDQWFNWAYIFRKQYINLGATIE